MFLPGESRGQKSLEGYSPRGPKESDTTKVTEYDILCQDFSFLVLNQFSRSLQLCHYGHFEQQITSLDNSFRTRNVVMKNHGISKLKGGWTSGFTSSALQRPLPGYVTAGPKVT